MGRSLRIGSVFGIGLHIHWSFLIVPFVALTSTWGSGAEAVLLSLGLVFGLFGCVLLHELGHALMARRFGIQTRDITLLIIGGVARLERMSEHPGEEIAIAVAGPLVNVVIAAGLWLGMDLAGMSPWASGELMEYGTVADKLMVLLLGANIMLVLFNMIPAFPMDGGRVFRALLSIAFGRLRGTELAVAVAKVIAVVFVGVGVLSFVGVLNWSPFLAVIGLFLMVAGNQELAMLRYQDQRRRYRMTLDEPPTVRPADEPLQPVYPPQAGFSGFTWDPRAGAWIEWRDGQPVGARYVNRAGTSW
jgi:Zn-dependent protease